MDMNTMDRVMSHMQVTGKLVEPLELERQLKDRDACSMRF